MREEHHVDQTSNLKLRVLWLSGNPSLFTAEKGKYNGGGWIRSLESALVESENICLGVAFFSDIKEFKIKKNDTTYYPINLYDSYLFKFRRQLDYEWADTIELNYYRKILNDYKPDVIHVWGTELSFGLINEITSIPVIIHFQGMLSAVYNSFYTPGMSQFTYLNQTGFDLISRFRKSRNLKYMLHSANREMRILRSSKNIMGRTTWDKRLVNLYAPNASYYHCDEILRPAFYKGKTWGPKIAEKHIIISTLSDATYKGLDIILKCANMIKNFSEICFEWHVYGVKDFRVFEKLTRINSQEVNVKFNGIVDSNYLREKLVEADIYVNTSYIDNSPNSLCEAQILGLPIISTNVGGISSIIKHEYSGVLVPANDPFILASEIEKLIKNSEQALLYSKNGRNEASIRHDAKRIVSALKLIYNSI